MTVLAHGRCLQRMASISDHAPLGGAETTWAATWVMIHYALRCVTMTTLLLRGAMLTLVLMESGLLEVTSALVSSGRRLTVCRKK